MVQSVQRALELLQILGSSNKKYSLAELRELSGLPPSTIHRLLLTLKESRFVSQDELSSLYYLGPALVTLGIKASNYIDIRKSAIPIMKRLANITGEDAYLAIADGNKGVFLERVAGPNPLKIIDPFGTQVPLHCGALRKVLLANKDEAFVRDYLSNKLQTYTESTVNDSNALLLELDKIKKEDIAVSIGEYIQDAVGIGAPVRDKFGNVISSIGIIGPITRLTKDTHTELIKLVKNSAEELSLALGYHTSNIINL